MNGFTNNAVIPIATKISNTYEISATYANSPVLASFLVYSLVNFPANHIIDTKGLRISFLIGAGLYVVGLFLFSFVNFGFHWVLLGQIIAALGQPFIINSPAKIATFWFTADNVSCSFDVETIGYRNHDGSLCDIHRSRTGAPNFIGGRVMLRVGSYGGNRAFVYFVLICGNASIGADDNFNEGKATKSSFGRG